MWKYMNTNYFHANPWSLEPSILYLNPKPLESLNPVFISADVQKFWDVQNSWLLLQV